MPAGTPTLAIDASGTSLDFDADQNENETNRVITDTARRAKHHPKHDGNKHRPRRVENSRLETPAAVVVRENPSDCARRPTLRAVTILVPYMVTPFDSLGLRRGRRVRPYGRQAGAGGDESDRTRKGEIAAC